MRSYLADFVAGVFLLAVLYVLVRPGSKGVDLVTGVGDVMTAIVSAATDIGSGSDSF